MTKDISATWLPIITGLDKDIRAGRFHLFVDTWLTVLACGIIACYGLDAYTTDSLWLRIIYAIGVLYMGWLARMMIRARNRSRYLLQHMTENRKAVLAVDAATNLSQLECAGDQLMAVLQNFRPQ